MKNITPRKVYEGENGYPASSEVQLTRRGFFGRVVATAAAVAGVTQAGSRGEAAPTTGTTASSARSVEPTRIRIDLPYQQPVPGTDLRPERVELFVKDRELIEFLRRGEERAGLQAAVTKVTSKAKAEDFYEGQRLFGLEQRIARSVEAQVRRRTKRPVPRLDLMLYAGHGMHIRTAGVMVRPLRPVISPHRSP